MRKIVLIQFFLAVFFTFFSCETSAMSKDLDGTWLYSESSGYNEKLVFNRENSTYTLEQFVGTELLVKVEGTYKTEQTIYNEELRAVLYLVDSSDNSAIVYYYYVLPESAGKSLYIVKGDKVTLYQKLIVIDEEPAEEATEE